jgi:5-enolpyruvylshikimate-3-phosphate synthase
MSVKALLTSLIQREQCVEIESEIKGEVVLEDGRFVTVHKIKVGHVAVASDDNQVIQAAKLIAVSCLFDGKQAKLQDVLNLDMQDFDKIMKCMTK